MNADRDLKPENAMLAWIDARIDSILRAPRMYGSDEAIEMQVILLLEARAFAADPERYRENPRRTFDTYVRCVADVHGRREPLFQVIATDRLGLNLAAALREVVRLVRSSA